MVKSISDFQQGVVTVVITTFNDESTITDAIESVRAQSYENIEILVVDDGSTDDTLVRANKVIETLPRARIISVSNQGLGSARSIGAVEATGEYLAFLDADDEYHPRKVEWQVVAISTRPRTILFTGAELRQVSGRILIRQDGGGLRVITDEYANGDVNPGAHASLMVRREDYFFWGGFDPGMRRFCEQHFLLRVLADPKAQVAILKNPLYIVKERLTSNRHIFFDRMPFAKAVFMEANFLIASARAPERHRLINYVQNFSWLTAVAAFRGGASYRGQLLALLQCVQNSNENLVKPRAIIVMRAPAWIATFVGKNTRVLSSLIRLLCAKQ